jgi:hypothetical protein
MARDACILPEHVCLVNTKKGNNFYNCQSHWVVFEVVWVRAPYGGHCASRQRHCAPAFAQAGSLIFALRWLRVLTNVKSFHNLHGTGNASGARAETMLFVAT